jgi:hypothetical protein
MPEFLRLPTCALSSLADAAGFAKIGNRVAPLRSSGTIGIAGDAGGRQGRRRGATGLVAAAFLACLTVEATAGEAPPFFQVRQALRQSHPEMAAFAKEARPVIAEADAVLLAAERQGRGDGCARQTLVELRWRVNSTVDVAAARDNLERLEAALRELASPQGHDSNILPQDTEGSYGACDREWFWKLDDSSDALLDNSGWHGAIPPRLLERVNTPASLIAYLDSIVTSDPAREGVDRRKELNMATSVLARVVLRGGVAGYLSGPEFRPALRAFLDRWQDPSTGFFGEWYSDHGRLIKTADLSATFHMARYTRGEIGHWPELIDTLLAIKDRPYPQGWLDDDQMTNHNNYDVAELFRLGWPHMREDQRNAARTEILRMLDWALTHSISADGEIARAGTAEPLGDMYYFASAFLDSVGYFDKRKRFWTDADFPQAEALRIALEAKARRIASDAPFAQATLERLSPVRPRDNVIIAHGAEPAARLSAAWSILMSSFVNPRPLPRP